jgi:HD-like signal output (HDOD) protein
MAELSTFLQSVKLPVMPEVAHALIRTLNEDDVDITKLRDVIAKDPALTTTLMRMANSAIFGLSRSVTTLDAAVNVVGVSQIRARALSICMANVFALPPSINRLQFWRESMTCAGYAKWLAVAKGMDENQAWLTGMMLRLGQLVIAQRDAALMDGIELSPRLPGERWERERSACGFDEGEITAEIARRWDFPEDMVVALAASARPMQAPEFSELGGVVHLAGLLADHAEVSVETLATLPEPVVQKLQLNLLWMSTHLPDAEAFSDISMLQS